MYEEVILDLKGLKCLGCVANVEKAVTALRGVKSAKVDLASAKGAFVFDPALVSTADIVAAIRKAGYDAAAVAR
jgi:copper chaperone CopZ